ncbi:uncharacterized protein RSE6_12925 [Rhynchosporium secalis]|uniref:Uncharacterized protein n=1 Tax=Rhynchosporium secalis TaxID=38038 RepID=A0A1E1MRK8_RHYSE|nr:uncharacterized protein RSE6_12925 [Rhynchosporium secalis]
MAGSRDSQTAGQPSDRSFSFDLEALPAQGDQWYLENEQDYLDDPPSVSQEPQTINHDITEPYLRPWNDDYQQYPPFDQPVEPPIPANQGLSRFNNNATASSYWDSITFEALPPEELVLQTPIPANHGSSSVPIVVTSPMITQWSPAAPEFLPPANRYNPPIPGFPSGAPVSRQGSRTPGGSFNNTILGLFTNPITPLRVIDTYKYPFEHELQIALEAELERQDEIEKKQDKADSIQAELKRRRESDENLQAEYDKLLRDLPVPATPAPTPAGDGSKTPRNRRHTNIESIDPNKWYSPLAIDPKTYSWGPINPDTLQPIYTYTEHGELDPQQVFSVQQMSEYISRGRARLWIQCVPADSSKRYPTATSEKCRFACCPDPKRTIRKGDFRVAFDEHPSSPNKDPFHNAAYTHLFCLEKNLDFPQMCRDKFDIRPDTRVLKEGKNKMAITRDHKSMADIVTNFVQYPVPWTEFNEGQPRPDNYYEFTLCSRLTKEHLAKQGKGVQAVRDDRGRGGNTLDKHQNNLDLYIANQKLKKTQPKVSRTEERKTRKRKAKGANKGRGEDSDESGLDEDILQRGLLSPSLSSRMEKRRKLSETESLRQWSRSSAKRKSNFGTREAEEEEIELLPKRIQSGRRIPSR